MSTATRVMAVLLTEAFYEGHADRLRAASSEAGLVLEPVLLGEQSTVSDEDLARVELAYFSKDRDIAGACPFYDALERAP